MRVLLLESWLCKSKKAANSFPYTLQVCQCSGCELCVFFCGFWMYGQTREAAVLGKAEQCDMVTDGVRTRDLSFGSPVRCKYAVQSRRGKYGVIFISSLNEILCCRTGIEIGTSKENHLFLSFTTYVLLLVIMIFTHFSVSMCFCAQ